MIKKEDISMVEILEAINDFSTKIEEKLDKLEARINQKIDDLKQEMDELLDYHETWLNRIEKNMVTKREFNVLLNILNKKGYFFL